MASEDDEAPRKDSMRRLAALFAISHVLLGLLCIIMGIVAIAFRCAYHNGGAPIWMGLLFLGTRVFGLLYAMKKTRCKTLSFMIMSIVSAVFSLLLFLFMLYALLQEDYFVHRTKDCRLLSATCVDIVRRNKIVDGVVMLLAAIEGIVAVLGSVVGCVDTCSCCQEQPEAKTTHVATEEGGQIEES
ncbi:uncharacterized protein [Ptychodera flava]|uniref:uncharacterized protein n=1 Tax=Ptychodera flava TaxID=63121 RepID=UPI003969C087